MLASAGNRRPDAQNSENYSLSCSVCQSLFSGFFEEIVSREIRRTGPVSEPPETAARAASAPSMLPSGDAPLCALHENPARRRAKLFLDSALTSRYNTPQQQGRCGNPTASFSVFSGPDVPRPLQVNIRRDEGEKYRGSSGPVSGGEWKPRTKESAGRTLRSGNLNAGGPVGGPGPTVTWGQLVRAGKGAAGRRQIRWHRGAQHSS